jgi:hypothetical protein
MTPTLRRDEVLSDEVWAQLDPHCGRLSRRTAAKIWIVAAGAVVALIAILVVYLAGFVTPRLHADGSSYSMERPVVVSAEHPATITMRFVLMNYGSTAVSIHSLGGPLDGDLSALTFVSTWNVPPTLPAHAGQEVTVTYQLTSCAGFTTSPTLPVANVPVAVLRWWGAQHLRIPVADDIENPCVNDE